MNLYIFVYSVYTVYMLTFYHVDKKKINQIVGLLLTTLWTLYASGSSLWLGQKIEGGRADGGLVTSGQGLHQPTVPEPKIS